MFSKNLSFGTYKFINSQCALSTNKVPSRTEHCTVGEKIFFFDMWLWVLLIKINCSDEYIMGPDTSQFRVKCFDVHCIREVHECTALLDTSANTALQSALSHRVQYQLTDEHPRCRKSVKIRKYHTCIVKRRNFMGNYRNLIGKYHIRLAKWGNFIVKYCNYILSKVIILS